MTTGKIEDLDQISWERQGYCLFDLTNGICISPEVYDCVDKERGWRPAYTRYSDGSSGVTTLRARALELTAKLGRPIALIRLIGKPAVPVVPGWIGGV